MLNQHWHRTGGSKSGWILTGICLLLWAVKAEAGTDPFLGAYQYPQFRNLSGLSGGGFGVDEQGLPSLSGPTAFSTPVAYTMGHEHVRAIGAELSFDSTPTIGYNNSNGTGVAALGLSAGPVNIMLADMVKSAHLDSAYNMQVELRPHAGQKLVGSLGVQDILGKGGTAGQGLPTDLTASSRSIFGVLTYRLDTPRHPVFLSAGWGDHRFGKGLGSVSYQIVRPLRGYVEYDGWGFNEGLLFTALGKSGHWRPEFDGMIGLVRGRYFALSGGIGF